MSHFLGLLFVDKNNNLDNLDEIASKMLAPYDENVAVTPYIKYTKDEAYNIVNNQHKEFYEKISSTGNLTEYEKIALEKGPTLSLEDARSEMEDLGDYLDEDLNVISTYNPKSKWDWYNFGGRYLSYLPYSDGVDGGLLDSVGKIDWNRILLKDDDYLSMDGGANIEKFETKGLPCCFIDKEGNWYERGKVGWWGTMDEEMTVDEWREVVKKYVNSLDKEDVVIVVDFHI